MRKVTEGWRKHGNVVNIVKRIFPQGTKAGLDWHLFGIFSTALKRIINKVNIEGNELKIIFLQQFFLMLPIMKHIIDTRFKDLGLCASLGTP